MADNPTGTRQLDIHSSVWSVLWKVKLPLKILTFIWKLLHDCLPLKLNFASRGIPPIEVCPMYNSETESASHLFLYSTLARAVWQGSNISIKTTNLNQILVGRWLARCTLENKKLDQENLNTLQALFTTLWTI